MSAGDEGWLSRKVSRVTRRIVNVMLLLTLASSNIRSRHQMVQRQHYNWAERKQEATIQLLHLHLSCAVRSLMIMSWNGYIFICMIHCTATALTTAATTVVGKIGWRKETAGSAAHLILEARGASPAVLQCPMQCRQCSAGSLEQQDCSNPYYLWVKLRPQWPDVSRVPRTGPRVQSDILNLSRCRTCSCCDCDLLAPGILHSTRCRSKYTTHIAM